MSEKLLLPDGEWALLRDPVKVPERLRRPVMTLTTRLQPQIKATKTAAEDGDDMVLDADVLERFEELNDLVIVAMVAEWSFELAISPETVGDLPGDAYDVLRREAAKGIKDLLPDFSPDPDPASPTGP